MADTLTAVTTVVRDNLDEATAAYWSDAEIQRKIVRRYRQLWSRIIGIRDDWFKSTTGATITVPGDGTIRFTLPADFFRVCNIRTSTSGRQYIQWKWKSCKDPNFIANQGSDNPSATPDVIYYDVEGVNTIVCSPYLTIALTATLDYYTIPTDPASGSSTFQIPDACLDYIVAASTADCLAKGPVGLIQYWQNEAAESWKVLLVLLGSPRSGQNADHALSMFESGN